MQTIGTGYGFTAYRKSDDAEVFRIDDLSVERGEVENLITMIVDNDVSVTHFEEVKIPLPYPRRREDMKRSDIVELKEMLIKNLRQEAVL